MVGAAAYRVARSARYRTTLATTIHTRVTTMPKKSATGKKSATPVGSATHPSHAWVRGSASSVPAAPSIITPRPAFHATHAFAIDRWRASIAAGDAPLAAPSTSERFTIAETSSVAPTSRLPPTSSRSHTRVRSASGRPTAATESANRTRNGTAAVQTNVATNCSTSLSSK